MKPKKKLQFINLFSNFKLRERMLLIFLISSIIPMILMSGYLFGNVRRVILEQSMDTEQSELELMAESIEHRMQIAADLAQTIEGDPGISRIATANYFLEDTFWEDYESCSFLSDYLRYYRRELEEIEIYVWNKTIPDNQFFYSVTSETWSEKWYMNVVNSQSVQYWAYRVNEATGSISLTVSRLLSDENNNPVAVVRMILPAESTRTEILERQEDTLLYYDDIMPLLANFSGDFDEINILLQHEKGRNMGAELEKYEGEDYIFSFLRIQPQGEEHYYTIVSLKPYSDIQRAVNQSAFRLILPTLVLMFLGFHLILLFAASYSKRLNLFKNSMHRAVEGELKEIPTIEGRDEIADLNRDLQAMIKDIQGLMDRLVQENVQKEKLHTRQREVEFKMLANQINPHFLYNTLETIRMTARVNNQPDIEELTKMLAKILRRNIQAGETLQTVTSEMQLIEYYLKIQDYRFHDRITYEVVIEDPDRVGPMKIMPLLIQPFVENAFGHGLEGMEEGGKITITARADSWLWIVVQDNGHGMTTEQLEELRDSMQHLEQLDRTHIGVCNVQQRIKYRYGEEYGVTIDSSEGNGTTVTLKLPVNAEFSQFS